MPRIRTIKPEIAHDVTLARISRESRYTLVLLISQADDQGLLLGNPRQLLGSLYPHDQDVTDDVLRHWLGELERVGIVRWRARADGQPVLQIVNWQRHQRVVHPHKPILLDSLLPEDSRESHEALAHISRGPRENLVRPSRTDLTTVLPYDHTTERPSSDAVASGVGAVAPNAGGSDRKSKPRRRVDVAPPSSETTAKAIANGWPAGVSDWLRTSCQAEVPPPVVGRTLKHIAARYPWADFVRAAKLYDAHRTLRRGRNVFDCAELAGTMPAILQLGVPGSGGAVDRYIDGGPLA